MIYWGQFTHKIRWSYLDIITFGNHIKENSVKLSQLKGENLNLSFFFRVVQITSISIQSYTRDVISLHSDGGSPTCGAQSVAALWLIKFETNCVMIDLPSLSLSSHAEHHAAIACASCMRGLFTAAGADREKCPGLRVYTHTSHQSAAGADAATSCTSVIGLIHSGKNRR